MVVTPVGQGPKDDAGYKTLDHFEQARNSGHVAHFGLSWLGSAKGHLGSVGHRAQDGADGHSNPEVPDLAASVRALRGDEEQGVDHRCCDIPLDTTSKNMSNSV